MPNQSARRALGGALLIVLVLIAALALNRPAPATVPRPQTLGTPAPPTATATPTPTPTATATRRPLVPGDTGQAAVTAGPTVVKPPLRVTPYPTAPAGAPGDPGHAAGVRRRIGVGLPLGSIDEYDWGQGLPGWYLSWTVQQMPPRPANMQFAQMVRLSAGEFFPRLDDIRAAARANPGALWLIGNEPDATLQDNVTPEQYVAAYRVLYPAIKDADLSAQVAIGGISQPTPLRMVYLDRVRQAYRAAEGREIPVDVWNIHGFILREERNSWGVGIPPGIALDQGQLYEVTDHANLEIFKQQIVDFRRWMAERGLRDKPLIISEYGILMPADLGFQPDKVAQFMTASFDYLAGARDATLGYPADDNRLVQAWCWYSVADTTYATSNLFDPATRQITPLGRSFVEYVARLP